MTSKEPLYECRKLAAGPLMEVHYVVPPQLTDGLFMREGYRDGGDGKTFHLSAEPGEELTAPAVCKKCAAQWSERLRVAGNTITFLNRAPAANFEFE